MAKSRKGIPCDLKLAEELKFLSDKTGKPQIQILRELIEKMVSVAATFENFNYWLQDSGDEIIITFYGKSRLVSGQIKSVPCLNEEQNELVDQKVTELAIENLANESSKVEKIEVKQTGPEILGDLQTKDGRIHKAEEKKEGSKND
jgi:hypothetical protein